MSSQNTIRTEGSRLTGSRRSTRKSGTRASAPLTYDIYCINFYDNGLRAVREEFISQVKDGLRRFEFLIDLDAEIKEAQNLSTDGLPIDPVSLIVARIGQCLKEYRDVAAAIEAENAFNLLKYFERHNPMPIRLRFQKAKPNGGESKRAPKDGKTTGTGALAKITCFGVTAKEHNRVGKGAPLSKRKYINDNPANTNILILIVGQLNKHFYNNLLGRGEPLAGIVHFLPKKCAYDRLVPRPRREKELQETIDGIQKDIHSLRKRVISKHVGIYQQELPQMSSCLATKFCKDIFDQLTWFLFDMQTLREQYQEYYFTPFVETDIKMNPAHNLKDNQLIVESLSIQGHYLNAELPAARNDDAIVYLYLESIMCTFGNPKDLMTEMEVLLLANPNSGLYTTVLDKVKLYANAFKSILKLAKRELLFVEQANPLLNSIISYMDQSLMQNIYYACLEYNVLRRYFTTGYILSSISCTPYNGDVELRHLPKFAKLYLTDDSVNQRIIQLIDEYDIYQVEEIQPSVKLYTFKRTLNEVFENENEEVIPTRLCFRDFTLYEMQQFLRDVVTPQMYEDAKSVDDVKSSIGSLFNTNLTQYANDSVNLAPNECPPRNPHSLLQRAFIRPKSLKERELLTRKTPSIERRTTSKYRKKDSISTNKSIRGTLFTMSKHHSGMSDSTTMGSDTSKFIGLSPDHPMLKGYNLDNTRQTIKTKTSKYFFEEGMIRLYEEKWNFRQMNKCLKFEIDKQTLHLTNDQDDMRIVSLSIRVVTPNGLSLRLLPKRTECARAVLNYPNGLSVYCENTFAENLWTTNNKLNERRRVCAALGCVIVFYNDDHMVLIMRYNGEVYRLYTGSESKEDLEEGAEEESNLSDGKSCPAKASFSAFKPLPRRKRTAPSTGRTTEVLSARSLAGADARRTKLSSSISSSTLNVRATQVKTGEELEFEQESALYLSIDPEMRFLEFLIAKFELNFHHLKLTTSLGSVVYVEDGVIRCDKPVKVTEWHDYFANESYAMREDGVRMIWSQDTLKCYHSDGTLITTRHDVGVDRGIIEDEIDKQISSSSSHNSSTHRQTEVFSIFSDIVYLNSAKSSITSVHPSSANRPKIVTIGEMEDEQAASYDFSFVTFAPTSFLIENQIYAATEFIFPVNELKESNLQTKINAVDNLEFSIFGSSEEECPKVSHQDDYHESSSQADPDEWAQPIWKSSIARACFDLKAEVNLPNMKITLDSDELNVATRLRKHGCDENLLVIRDDVNFKLNMRQSLNVAFNNWISEFHNFISCRCPKLRTIYFVESTTNECRKKGIELFKSVPPLGNYKHCAGNFFIDPTELFSVNSTMERPLESLEADMAKFPRFLVGKPPPKTPSFPTVLSTSIYLEIPAQLAYTDRIHLFMKPLEMITFRRLRKRFSEAMYFTVHPHLVKVIRKETSSRSWKKRQLDNQRRRFMEQQRLSLYVAMLKHKVYPNYFTFRDDYHFHVRNIDFFEFMAAKCKDTHSQFNTPSGSQAKIKEKDKDVDDSSRRSTKPTVSVKSRRKKCPCPKYLKSLT